MIARRFIDTNILLYSISRDPDETRKRKPVRSSAARSRGQADSCLAAFPVQDITIGILMAALEIKAEHGFSY
jgi:hypothetical protein